MKFSPTIFFLTILCLTSPQTGHVLLAGEPRLEETFTREIPLEPGGSLRLNNIIGKIEVCGWDKNTVQIKAVKQVRKVFDRLEAQKLMDEMEIKINKSGDRVEIETVFPRHIQIDGNDGWLKVLYKISRFPESCEGEWVPLAILYEIKLPRNTDVNLYTAIGEIEVCDMDGDLEVKSVIGSLDLLRLEGDLRADLSIGEIKLKQVRGSVTADAGTGEIKAVFDQVEEGKNIDLSLLLGDIRLTLPASLAADLDISTGLGALDLDFPTSNIEGKLRKRKIKGKINGGGPQITVRSSLGQVKIKELP